MMELITMSMLEHFNSTLLHLLHHLPPIPPILLHPTVITSSCFIAACVLLIASVTLSWVAAWYLALRKIPVFQEILGVSRKRKTQPPVVIPEFYKPVTAGWRKRVRAQSTSHINAPVSQHEHNAF